MRFLIKEQFIVTTIESEATSEYLGLGKNLEITELNHPKRCESDCINYTNCI